MTGGAIILCLKSCPIIVPEGQVQAMRGDHFQRWDRALEWPEATANQDIWQYYYGGIYRANTYLEYEAYIDWTGNEELAVAISRLKPGFLEPIFIFTLPGCLVKSLLSIIPLNPMKFRPEHLPKISII